MVPEHSGQDDAGQTVAGMDGCRGRWLCVWGNVNQPGQVRAALLDQLSDLDTLVPQPVVVGVDIPMGLSDTGPRDCDRAARAALGRPRGSSVFPAPLRCMIDAEDYPEACAIGRAKCGRALSRQAWNIVPLIRAMDGFLRERRDWAERIHEVHPEVSFMVWNGGSPMTHNKKRSAGDWERAALIEQNLPGALAATKRALAGQRYARDDLVDAVAAFWSAERIARGQAVSMPEAPERDAYGLPMVIRA